MVDIENTLNTLSAFCEKPRIAMMALLLSSSVLVMTTIAAINAWQNDAKLTHTPSLSTTLSDREKLLASAKTIVNSHLFGISKTAVLTDELPITSLPLTLVGVMQSVPANQSSAVIATDRNDPGKLYRIDDMLPGEARLISITQNGIVLETQGHLERLPLRRPSVSFQGSPTPLPLKER